MAVYELSVTVHKPAVAGPDRERRHHQVADRDERVVVIHAPAGKISPGLFAVRLERQPGGLQLCDDRVEFGTVDADGLVGIVRILGIGSYRNELAILRSARKPARMHRSADGSCGTSTTARVMAAPSSTAPVAVIHDISWFGERKKTSAASVVWLSSTSANQISQVRQ